VTLRWLGCVVVALGCAPKPAEIANHREAKREVVCYGGNMFELDRSEEFRPPLPNPRPHPQVIQIV
jgi:hypothetical protein